MTHPLVRTVLVAAAVVGITAGAMAWPDAESATRGDAASTSGARRVPVEQARLVCPEPRTGPDRQTLVTGVSVPARLPPKEQAGKGQAGKGQAGKEQAGKLALLPLGDPPAKDLAATERRGRAATYDVPAKSRGPVLAGATGSAAPGATAGQSSRATQGKLRGLAETPCVRPSDDFWFVGAGSQIGRDGRLFLTNVDQKRVSLDLELFDENGRVRPGRDRVVTVRPHGRRVIALDDLAPTSQRLAVSIHARTGRVAAALRDSRVDGEDGAGVDWIPPSAAPSKDLVVPGIPSGKGKRTLMVATPRESSAVVNVSVLGKNGTFRPAENGELKLDPGSVGKISLDRAVRSEDAAVRITSAAPVTASVRTEVGTGDDAREFSYSAAAAPLSGPAAVPSTSAGADVQASLLLSNAGQRPGAAEVRLLSPEGKQIGRQRVRVGPGSTVRTKLAAPKGSSRYVVVVDPDKGSSLYGTRLVEESTGDGPMTSQWPLSTAPTTQWSPTVRSGLVR